MIPDSTSRRPFFCYQDMIDGFVSDIVPEQIDLTEEQESFVQRLIERISYFFAQPLRREEESLKKIHLRAIKIDKNMAPFFIRRLSEVSMVEKIVDAIRQSKQDPRISKDLIKKIEDILAPFINAMPIEFKKPPKKRLKTEEQS